MSKLVVTPKKKYEIVCRATVKWTEKVETAQGKKHAMEMARRNPLPWSTNFLTELVDTFEVLSVKVNRKKPLFGKMKIPMAPSPLHGAKKIGVDTQGPLCPECDREFDIFEDKKMGKGNDTYKFLICPGCKQPDETYFGGPF